MQMEARKASRGLLSASVPQMLLYVSSALRMFSVLPSSVEESSSRLSAARMPHQLDWISCSQVRFVFSWGGGKEWNYLLLSTVRDVMLSITYLTEKMSKREIR